MRRAILAPVVLVAAVAGGAAALGLGIASGLVGGHTETVVLPASTIAGVPVPASAALGARAGGFDAARVYAQRSPGVVTIFAYFGKAGAPGSQAAQGSGFVVDGDGTILTNSHVITNAGEGVAVAAADRLYVEFSDHDRIPARVVGWDIYDDVGVIAVDPNAHALAPVPLGDSARVVVGESVAAIGSPFGNENSLAVGVVSAVQRSISSLTSDYQLIDAIQTDAPINHGNSGGPLFDARGAVIGINAQIRTEANGSADGVGFAVPIDSARRSMQQLLEHGRVAYAYVGITSEDLTPTLARHFGYAVAHGAVVDSVRSGGPGAKAGIRGGNRDVQVFDTPFTRGGDVIVAIDGLPVSSADDVVRIVSEHLQPGQTVRFTVVRGGRRLELPVTLTERPTS
jgi:2-alkenal reductase